MLEALFLMGFYSNPVQCILLSSPMLIGLAIQWTKDPLLGFQSFWAIILLHGLPRNSPLFLSHPLKLSTNPLPLLQLKWHGFVCCCAIFMSFFHNVLSYGVIIQVLFLQLQILSFTHARNTWRLIITLCENGSFVVI